MRVYNFGVVSITSRNFTGGMAYCRGDQVDTNFTRGAPTIFGRVKNVQNSARFLTTFEFDRKYLRDGSTYRKSEKYFINYISFPIGRRKFGELWSTNNKVTRMLTHPTGLFSEDYISVPRGRWPFRFLHALDTDEGLLAHATNRVGGPPKFLRANI